MSDLNTKLEYLEDTKTAIKNAIVEKGVEVSDSDTFRSYAEKISTITSGGSSGETNYLGRIVTEDGVLQLPTESFSFSLPSNITSIDNYGLNSAFSGCIKLTSVDLSNLTSIGNNGLSDAFYACINLTSVDLSNLTSIGYFGLNSAFYHCTNLTSTGLNNVTSIDNYGLTSAFSGCTNLTSTGLNNVTSIGYNGLSSAFRGCTNLTSVDLSNLTSIGNNGLSDAFSGCTSLTSISFPALNSNSFGSFTNQFNRMLQGVSGCTVHFPSNLESIIGDWSDVTSGFGGTNTTVLFDLPATT